VTFCQVIGMIFRPIIFCY